MDNNRNQNPSGTSKDKQNVTPTSTQDQRATKDKSDALNIGRNDGDQRRDQSQTQDPDRAGVNQKPGSSDTRRHDQERP